MKIFFDTEFIEDGKTIELLSIGLVREDGEFYYAEPAEADFSRKPSASLEETEAQILKSIMQLLKRHPKVAMCWRQNSGTFREGDRFIRANTARGMSDIMGTLKNGRTLAIEVKSRAGTIQPHQVEFLAGITKAGGLAFVARDVETVARVLAGA